MMSVRTRPEVEGADYLDTLALLQEEVARLEHELRCREEAAPPEARPEPAPQDHLLQARIEELNAALEARDETIALLLEHLRVVEEARDADRAEWDQLLHWVEEIERNLEAAPTRGPTPVANPTPGRDPVFDPVVPPPELPESGHLLGPPSADDVHRTGQPAGGTQAAPSRESREAELDEEVRRLRAELAALRAERDAMRGDRASSTPGVEPVAASASLTTQTAAADGLSPSERIRALRLHLNEIQKREQEERSRRRLSARIARLWRGGTSDPTG